MPVRKKKRMDLVLPTSSMGDIAFLLIIFFILASNFMKTANIEHEKPVSEEIDKVEESVVSVDVDKDGKIYVQGVEIPESMIDSAVTQAKGDMKDAMVHVTIDRNLTKKSYMKVVESLSGIEGIKVAYIGDK